MIRLQQSLWQLQQVGATGSCHGVEESCGDVGSWIVAVKVEITSIYDGRFMRLRCVWIKLAHGLKEENPHTFVTVDWSYCTAYAYHMSMIQKVLKYLHSLVPHWNRCSWSIGPEAYNNFNPCIENVLPGHWWMLSTS